MNKHFAFGLTMVLALAALAPAQSLLIPDNINAGDKIVIRYENPARAGQTIPIVIAVSNPEITVTEVLVVLDSDGRGSVPYTVPNAFAIAFNAMDCRQVTRFL